MEMAKNISNGKHLPGLSLHNAMYCTVVIIFYSERKAIVW